MIVAETADGYQFVTQPAHARLAGQFADHWGNDAFERPVPSAPVRLAAHAHDTGWEAYDRRPHLDDDGEPVDFREMPAGTWTDLYDEGIDAVAGMDRYAGLLVSMHGAGLRNRRYGLSPSWPETPPAFEGFVRREETRQTRLLAELRETRDSVSAADADLLAALHEDCAVPEGYDGRLWPNYKLLQAWDTLSLAFCVADSPPGYPRIEAVPTAADGPDETLTVAAAGDGQFRVDPYPFDTSPLSVSVPVRTVETGFEGEAELLRAYYGTPLETRQVTLRRAES